MVGDVYMATTRKPDKTRNERQARRRIREKEWLKEHGFNSWEAFHTSLMKDETRLTKREPDLKLRAEKI
jgi:hypothetical protein